MTSMTSMTFVGPLRRACVGPVMLQSLSADVYYVDYFQQLQIKGVKAGGCNYLVREFVPGIEYQVAG